MLPRVSGCRIALTAAAALVVLLAVQKRSLRSELHAALLRSERPYPGFVVPTFAAVSLDGDSFQIGDPPPGGSQLLFFFSTDCPFCAHDFPYWVRISRRLLNEGHPRLRVFGVSISPASETREFLRDKRPAFPVVLVRDNRLLELYRVRGTPLTMVIGEAGVVRFSRFAAFTESAAASDSLMDAVRVGPAAEE